MEAAAAADESFVSQIPLPPPVPLMDLPKNVPPHNNEPREAIDESIIMNALNLSWCFGFNKQIGIRNLCVNDDAKLFLASSHIGVVYDFEKNQQKLLQGHVI